MPSSLAGSTLVGCAAAAVLGLVAGVTATLAHLVVLPLGAVDVPVGLVLGLCLVAVVQAGLVAAWPTPLVAVAGVLGWVAAVYVGLATGPGGDFLVVRPLGGLGAAWVLGGAVVLAVATRVSRRISAGPAPASLA